jgi:hypothetical protein
VNTPKASRSAAAHNRPTVAGRRRTLYVANARVVPRLCILLLAAALPLRVLPSAHAEPSNSEKGRATTLMDTGAERLGQGRYAQALEAFKQADAIMDVPVTRVAVAQTLEKLGRLVEARDAAVQATRMPMGSNEPEPFTMARVQAAKIIVDLEVRIPTLAVFVENLPPDVTPLVRIDGAPLAQDKLGLPQRVNPGSHRVTLSAPGWEEVEEEISISERATNRVALGLRRRATQPSVEASHSTSTPPLVYAGFAVGVAGLVASTVTGILSSDREADAKQKCSGPGCAAEFDRNMSASDNLRWASNLSLGVAAAGVGVGTAALLTSGDQRLPPASTALGSLGLLSIGSFAYFGITGKHQESNLKSSCAPTCSHDDYDTMRRRLLIADVSLAVGVVSLGAATWVALAAKKGSTRRDATSRLEARPLPGGGALLVSGSF